VEGAGRGGVPYLGSRWRGHGERSVAGKRRENFLAYTRRAKAGRECSMCSPGQRTSSSKKKKEIKGALSTIKEKNPI